MNGSSTSWSGDACSLVAAFRSGERHPVEELECTLAAIADSPLNAFSFLAPDRALAAAAVADVQQPFGGVALGVKELGQVTGWPDTEACVVFRDRVASHTSTMVDRLQQAGAIAVGLTTSSEFGGVNLTRTMLNGVTRNPWDLDRTPGGSSGGSAAAVAGGLVALATGGDGGGSIRIPAGFCGLVGLKVSYGRIPKGPVAHHGNHTAVPGCVSRSVRDTARWLDVTNGYDPRDARSLPRVEGYEPALGSSLQQLRGKRAAIVLDFGGAFVAPDVADVVREGAEWLIAELGLARVDVSVALPSMGAAWSITGLLEIRAALGDAWPACADELTPEMRHGLRWAEGKFDERSASNLEERRIGHDEAMADMFEQADIVFTASNPDVAFGAEGPLPTVFGGREVGGWNNGRLTAPANLYGSPAISVPIGSVDGLPVGLQAMSAHHTEPLLLDLALAVERSRPWPLVAPSLPR